MATPVLTPERLAASYTYSAYRHLIDELQAEGKTTGPQQSELLTNYTRLNVQRMSRIDKTIQLLPELQAALKALPQHYAWLIITEGWCGDAAQIVPVLEAAAKASQGNVTTHYLLRDQNLDLMDQYLTAGGRSIPKLVILQADTLTEVANWGPRPATAQQMFLDLKSQDLPFEEFSTQLHAWYAKDKTKSTQHELLTLLQGL
jgi:hypothetical protein